MPPESSATTEVFFIKIDTIIAGIREIIAEEKREYASLTRKQPPNIVDLSFSQGRIDGMTEVLAELGAMMKESAYEPETVNLRVRGLPMIAFPFGATVYMRLREERVPGMVTGYRIRPGLVSYTVCWSNTGQEIEHYEMELSTEHEPYQ